MICEDFTLLQLKVRKRDGQEEEGEMRGPYRREGGQETISALKRGTFGSDAAGSLLLFLAGHQFVCNGKGSCFPCPVACVCLCECKYGLTVYFRFPHP